MRRKKSQTTLWLMSVHHGRKQLKSRLKDRAWKKWMNRALEERRRRLKRLLGLHDRWALRDGSSDTIRTRV